MPDQNVTQSQFEFTFYGDNELNVETLITGLQSLNSLVMSTKETCLENTECNLKVVAHRPGSFIADLAIFAQTANTLFTPEQIDYAANCVELIVSFFEIKKFIGNHLPKRVEKKHGRLEVDNSEGKTARFTTKAEGFFKNATIENSIIQIITCAENNPEVNGIKITATNQRSAEIRRSEFSTVDEPVIDNIEHPVKELKSTDLFYIRQSACFGDSKWEFQKDHRFYAKILDAKWMKEYHEGKHAIIPGIQLKVEMTSYVRIGEDGLPIEGKTTYEITKVIDTIYPESAAQQRLF